MWWWWWPLVGAGAGAGAGAAGGSGVAAVKGLQEVCWGPVGGEADGDLGPADHGQLVAGVVVELLVSCGAHKPPERVEFGATHDSGWCGMAN